jgi:hypothetical protein
MPHPAKLEKAMLRHLDVPFGSEIQDDHWVTVQFNPETLKVSFANQLAGADKTNPGGIQFVGAGTTKLNLQLWFDVTAPLPEGVPRENDVRKLTQKVAYYITPQEQGEPKTFVPPAVRFVWGSFQFDGIMESLEESLELFSPEGRPLRASLALTLSQQRITKFVFANTGATGAAPGIGTRPMAQASNGSTVQSLAADAGQRGDWQSIAAANGIENPRRMQPGQLIDLNPRRLLP